MHREDDPGTVPTMLAGVGRIAVNRVGDRVSGLAGSSPDTNLMANSDQPIEEHLPTRKTAQNVVLIDRARRGDNQAFATLYQHYRSEVHRYLLSRTPDRHLAEDLTSETFLHALRGIDTFRWKGRDFGAWLVTIARNLLSDHYKCARHRREVLVMDISMHDAPLPSAEETVLDVMETRLNNRLALDAVAALPPHWRKVIIWRYWEGWRDHLIAQQLDLPTAGAVRVMRYRAMRDLRKTLVSARTAKRRTTAVR